MCDSQNELLVCVVDSRDVTWNCIPGMAFSYLALAEFFELWNVSQHSARVHLASLTLGGIKQYIICIGPLCLIDAFVDDDVSYCSGIQR